MSERTAWRWIGKPLAYAVSIIVSFALLHAIEDASGWDTAFTRGYVAAVLLVSFWPWLVARKPSHD